MMFKPFTSYPDRAVTIRFDSVRTRSDRFDPIHYIHLFRPIRLKFITQCHLNDLLNKITMNKITMNKEHKIHDNRSASNCNIIILFSFIKINLLAFSGNNAIEEVKIVDRFSESIQEF